MKKDKQNVELKAVKGAGFMSLVKELDKQIVWTKELTKKVLNKKK
jgi:hypothetical protein